MWYSTFISLVLIVLPSLIWGATSAPAPPLFSGGSGTNELHYASPSGSSTSCSQDNPCSLNTCIQQTSADESCILLNGTYNQRLLTVRSGAEGRHIVIRAQNKGQAIIRASGGNTVEIRHNYITISGLFVNDLQSSAKGEGQIRINRSGGIHHVIIEDNTMFHAGNVCLAMTGLNAQDHHIIVRRNLCDGTAYNTEDGVEPPGEGFYIGQANEDAPGGADIMIYENEIRDFTSNAIDIKQSTRRVWAWGNNIHGAVPFQVRGLPADVRDGIIIMQGTENYAYGNRIHDNNVQSQILKIMRSDAGANLFYNNIAYNNDAMVNAIRTENNFGFGGGHPHIFNNTFSNNDAYTVNVQDSTAPVVLNNIGINGRSGNLSTSNYDSSYFVNAEDGNFHLTSNAVNAIDNVTSDPFSPADFDGAEIVNGARDYGAFERLDDEEPPPPPPPPPPTSLAAPSSLRVVATSEDDIILQWVGHEDATHYRIYQSVDGGHTWEQAGHDIPQPDSFPLNGEVLGTIQNVPEDEMVLFRASTLRGTDECLASHQGVWIRGASRDEG